MSTIYEKSNRRKTLIKNGSLFTSTFHNCIDDFFTDDFHFDLTKFKDKVLQIPTEDDVYAYLDHHYNKDIVKYMRFIIEY